MEVMLPEEPPIEKYKAESQAIFDTVAKHLAAQGRRAVGGAHHDLCRYRAPDGTKCAVGCLINDDEYDPAMEGMSFGISEGPWPQRLIPHMWLILGLQSAHDLRQEGSNCATIRDRLERIAHRWNLDSSILSTLTFPEVWK